MFIKDEKKNAEVIFLLEKLLKWFDDSAICVILNLFPGIQHLRHLMLFCCFGQFKSNVAHLTRVHKNGGTYFLKLKKFKQRITNDDSAPYFDDFKQIFYILIRIVSSKMLLIVKT